MKYFIRFITFLLFFSFAGISLAQDNPNGQELRRSNLTHIRIISTSEDNISLYLTDSSQQVYRISSLNEDDAQTILNRFRNGSPLIINTQDVDKRDYLDVTDWK